MLCFGRKLEIRGKWAENIFTPYRHKCSTALVQSNMWHKKCLLQTQYYKIYLLIGITFLRYIYLSIYLSIYLGMYEPTSVGITSDIAHIYPEATFIGKVYPQNLF